jgi:hypothetical protein
VLHDGRHEHVYLCSEAHDNSIEKEEKTMNRSKGTALVTALRNMETTVKTLAADSAVSAERALNAAIVSADITRSFEEYVSLVDQYCAEDIEVSTDVSPDPLVGKTRLTTRDTDLVRAPKMETVARRL